MKKALLMALGFYCFCSFNGLSVMAAGTTAPQDQAKQYISGVRIGGWIADDALLVLPDRTAAAVPIGKNFSGVTLLEIGNHSFKVDYNGTKGNVTLDPGWQLAPHPDLTNWLIAFMKSVGAKIDAQTPDVTQEGVITVSQNGVAKSSFMKVELANPFQTLPDWMESINIKVLINPHDPTKVQFITLKVTPEAYKRLLR